MIYNLANAVGLGNAKIEFERLKSIGAVIELKKKSNVRSSAQNRALHLLFTQVAHQLNESGLNYVYSGLQGMEIETEWTAELFKQVIWKPLQEVICGTTSTTKLKTTDIDKVFAVINRHFGEMGLVITFPREFDRYLGMYE